MHKVMITVYGWNCNAFSQESYNQMLDSLELQMVTCSCGKSGCLIRYGFYHRMLRFLCVLLHLRIQRVFCKECRRTHAVLPSVIVPYSGIPIHDQQEIIAIHSQGQVPNEVMERNDLIDENNIKHILSQFRKHWKERIASLCLDVLEDLTVPCLSNYSMQFMQIHRIRNKLFCLPT